MGIANKNSGEESSGLYDLKELATSAKKRRTQRMSSEMDAQQSLLQSSAGLDAVALPDPKKSQEISIPVMGLDIASGANTTKLKSLATSAAPAVTEMAQERSSSKGWILAGVALIAVAGAAAAFVFLKGDSGTNKASVSAAAAATNPESEIATPVQALPALVDDQEDEAPAADLEEVEAPTVSALAAEVGDETVDKDKLEGSSKDKSARSDENKAAEPAHNDKNVDSKEKSNESDDKTRTANVEAKVVADKKEDKKAEKLDGSASVDDILSSVTGGVENHEAIAEDKGPSKKQLERGDIAKAMKKISPQAKGCYSEEEFSGVVTVKYSVSPDGSVTGAKATGAHASSKTGACVVRAVNAASFPPFSGAATSFSFPFLLSP